MAARLVRSILIASKNGIIHVVIIFSCLSFVFLFLPISNRRILGFPIEETKRSS